MQINRVNNNSNLAFGNAKVKRAATKAYDIYSAVTSGLFTRAKALGAKGVDTFIDKKVVSSTRDPELRTGPLPWHGKR